MTVERVSFKGGLPMVAGEEPKDTVVKAMGERKGTLVSLPAGEYDLTPKEWTHNKFAYYLRVDPDGTGECRVTPLYPDSASAYLDGSDFRVGERHFPIAKGHPSMIIAGGNEAGLPSIYECLIYNPGKSPER